ncbi:hypothetical protein BH11BAC3_BH11BAC3_14330 [soil metagenome]
MNNLKSILNIITGLLLCVLSLWATTSNLKFAWLAVIFIGGISILILIRYFIKDTNGQFNNTTKKPLNELMADDGIFTFSDKGFQLKISQTIHQLEWRQVKTMIAYKMDRFASDDICMDVFCDNGVNFTISEETPGWYRFIDISKKHIAEIANFWEIEMVTPGNEANLSIVYDRHNRNMGEIEKEYYSS